MKIEEKKVHKTYTMTVLDKDVEDYFMVSDPNLRFSVERERTNLLTDPQYICKLIFTSGGVETTFAVEKYFTLTPILRNNFTFIENVKTRRTFDSGVVLDVTGELR